MAGNEKLFVNMWGRIVSQNVTAALRSGADDKEVAYLEKKVFSFFRLRV